MDSLPPTLTMTDIYGGDQGEEEDGEDEEDLIDDDDSTPPFVGPSTTSPLEAVPPCRDDWDTLCLGIYYALAMYLLTCVVAHFVHGCIG
jgi:hypothetical protein